MKSHDKAKVESNNAKRSVESTSGNEAPRTAKTLPRKTISSAVETIPTERALQERIAQRAYELYLRRGQVPGHDVSDWLEAERQILTQPEVPFRAKMRKPRKESKHPD